MHLPKKVTICDVGPRDGLQTICTAITTAAKIKLVEGLAAAGLARVEAGSFVNPRVMPQMADSGAVLAGIIRRPGVRYRALALNARGWEQAQAAGADHLCLVVLASETFQQKNARSTVAGVMAAYAPVVTAARAQGVYVQGSVGTAFGCPYEGAIASGRILDLVRQWVDYGADEVSLADTTGMADPRQVLDLCTRVRERWPALALSLHFHNTRGLGLANVLAGLQAGVTIYDASVGGLGGCPFAPRASGNICTEDLVHMLHCLGIETGIDLEQLCQVASWLEATLGLPLSGQVMKAGPRWQTHRGGGA